HGTDPGQSSRLSRRAAAGRPRGERPAIHRATGRRVPLPERHHEPPDRRRGLHRRPQPDRGHLARDRVQGPGDAGQLRAGGEALLRRRIRPLRLADRRPHPRPLPLLRGRPGRAVQQRLRPPPAGSPHERLPGGGAPGGGGRLLRGLPRLTRGDRPPRAPLLRAGERVSFSGTRAPEMETTPRPPGFRGPFLLAQEEREPYSRASGVLRALPRAAALPVDAEDVATLVRWAAATRTP